MLMERPSWKTALFVLLPAKVRKNMMKCFEKGENCLASPKYFRNFSTSMFTASFAPIIAPIIPDNMTTIAVFNCIFLLIH